MDVGCGRGEFLDGFKKLGLTADGMDLEIDGIDVGKNNFPFPDKKFDFVFSKSVIEHLSEPDNFIKEIYRILKPGGRIIVMTPDWQSQIYIYYDDYTHRHPYTATGLKDLLNIYGFKESSAETFYQLPVLWKYPWLKIFSKFLQVLGPPRKIYKNKFIRWSKELMVLGSAIK